MRGYGEYANICARETNSSKALMRTRIQQSANPTKKKPLVVRI
jgi:hypothetical protein